MKKAMLKVILGICMSAVLISGCGRSTGTQQNVVETGQEVQQDSELADDSSEHSNENTQDGGNGQEDVNGKEEDGEDTTKGREVYSYEEMSVKIPASWEGKYIIDEGPNGFSFMQKSSFEKEEGWGFLFGFYRSDEMVDQSTGATQLAYTEEYAYYVQSPTDVTFWYEDENIATEYNEMLLEREAIINSFTVSQQDVRYDAREYVLPMSQSKPIPEY